MSQALSKGISKDSEASLFKTSFSIILGMFVGDSLFATLVTGGDN